MSVALFVCLSGALKCDLAADAAQCVDVSVMVDFVVLKLFTTNCIVILLFLCDKPFHCNVAVTGCNYTR